MHVRDVIFQTATKISLTKGDVVELTQRPQAFQDALGFIGIQAAFDAFITRHL